MLFIMSYSELRPLHIMINKDHDMIEADNPSLFFMVAHSFIHIGSKYRPQSSHWNIHNSSTDI